MTNDQLEIGFLVLLYGLTAKIDENTRFHRDTKVTLAIRFSKSYKTRSMKNRIIGRTFVRL